MTTVEVVHRNRFLPLPDADATEVAGGAWSVRIPTDSTAHRTTRRAPTAEGWDGAIFSINGIETQPAVGSAETRTHVVVTALIF